MITKFNAFLIGITMTCSTSEHMKPGFDAGVFAKLPVTQGFSIQPELIYRLKGAKDTYDNFVQGGSEYRFNLGYVELPLPPLTSKTLPLAPVTAMASPVSARAITYRAT
jgi:hypothetical protein